MSHLALPGSEAQAAIYSSLSDGHWQLAPGPGPQRTKSPSWLPVCLFVSCSLGTIPVGPWGLFHWHLALPLPVPSTTSSSDGQLAPGPGPQRLDLLSGPLIT